MDPVIQDSITHLLCFEKKGMKHNNNYFSHEFRSQVFLKAFLHNKQVPHFNKSEG